MGNVFTQSEATGGKDSFSLGFIGNESEIVHIFNNSVNSKSDGWHVIVLSKIERQDYSDGEGKYCYTFLVRLSCLGYEDHYTVDFWFYSDRILNKEDAVKEWEEYLKEGLTFCEKKPNLEIV